MNKITSQSCKRYNSISGYLSNPLTLTDIKRLKETALASSISKQKYNMIVGVVTYSSILALAITTYISIKYDYPGPQFLTIIISPFLMLYTSFIIQPKLMKEVPFVIAGENYEEVNDFEISDIDTNNLIFECKIPVFKKFLLRLDSRNHVNNIKDRQILNFEVEIMQSYLVNKLV